MITYSMTLSVPQLSICTYHIHTDTCTDVCMLAIYSYNSFHAVTIYSTNAHVCVKNGELPIYTTAGFDQQQLNL